MMFVEGFEPSTSGFVDQRSMGSAELHEQSLGDRIRTCVGLLPRQVGDRCPTPRKFCMEPVGLEPTISSLQDWRLSGLATIPEFQTSDWQLERWGSNPRPTVCKTDAAAAELRSKKKLRDVDSNHDQQSQNLPSCQLDDLSISKGRR